MIGLLAGFNDGQLGRWGSGWGIRKKNQDKGSLKEEKRHC
jgi:hypothetical protein